MQAMAIVNERHNATKPVQVDPKTGRPLPPSAVPPRAASPSLDLPPDNNSGFFGSFFAPKNKKKMAAMDSPPPQLKASGTLSEKEANEVEVISKLPHSIVLIGGQQTLELLINSYFHITRRTMIDMVPKAIMLNLVQYVFVLSDFLQYPSVRRADMYIKGTPKMKCSASSWKICTAPARLTTYSRKATTLYEGGRNACRWLSRYRKRARLSARFSKGHVLVEKDKKLSKEIPRRNGAFSYMSSS